MFCPNCCAENRSEQNFCRSCGLNLNAVTLAISEQFPSEEYARLERNKELFQKLGNYSLSVAGIVAASFLVSIAVYYKMIFLGPEVLFWSGFGALIGFLLMSIFFFNYPKYFMKLPKLDTAKQEREQPVLSIHTGKLIEDRPFDPVPSVTEDSTDLLRMPDDRRNR